MSLRMLNIYIRYDENNNTNKIYIRYVNDNNMFIQYDDKNFITYIRYYEKKNIPNLHLCMMITTISVTYIYQV